MRKGNIFEAQINKIIKYVTDNGYEAHKNNALRTLDGKFIEGEPFDYEILIPGHLYTFDAKECHGDKWNINLAKPKQLWHLTACKKAGFKAFFYVWFVNLNKLIAFDVDVINHTDKKSLAPEDGEELNLGDDITRAIKLLRGS